MALSSPDADTAIARYSAYLQALYAVTPETRVQAPVLFENPQFGQYQRDRPTKRESVAQRATHQQLFIVDRSDSIEDEEIGSRYVFASSDHARDTEKVVHKPLEADNFVPPSRKRKRSHSPTCEHGLIKRAQPVAQVSSTAAAARTEYISAPDDERALLRNGGQIYEWEDSEDLSGFEPHDPYHDTLDVRKKVQGHVADYAQSIPLEPVRHVNSQQSLLLKQLLWFKICRVQRPWLPVHAQRSLVYNNENLTEGTLLHVEFTDIEQMQVQRHILSRQFLDLPISDKAKLISKILPGRSIKDVLAYLQELPSCPPLTKRDSCLIYKPQHNQHRISQLLRHRSLQTRSDHVSDLQAVSTQFLRPDRYFDRTSGDINDIAFSGSMFALGCIATNDEYNRSGNLILHNGSMRVLEHKSGETGRYPSISCIKFVCGGDILLSGGTDGTLKMWSRKGNFLHEKTQKSRISVNDICSPFSQIAISSHGSGHLDIHSFTEDYPADTTTLDVQNLVAPATTCYNPISRRLIVGFESQDRTEQRGMLATYDLEKRCRITEIKHTETYAHVAVAEEGLWIAGSNSEFDGTVALYDQQGLCIQRMKTTQHDINEVSIRDNLITCAGTESSCYVWDIRHPLRPLHILQHGPSKQVQNSDDITGITNTAYLCRDRFITGGSDGCVKLWNLNAASNDAYIRDFAHFDSPITRLALNETRDTLIIGENRGTAHIYSYNGNERQLLEIT